MKKYISALILLLIVSALIYFFLNYRILPRDPYKYIIKQEIDYRESSSLMNSTIFYPSRKTGRIEKKTLPLPRVRDNNDKISIIIAEYLKASELDEIVIKSVFYSQKTHILYIDFRQFSLPADGGAIDEYLFLYGLIKNIDYSFPFVFGVQFMKNGKYENSLNGHISISDPIIIKGFLLGGGCNET